MDRLELAVIDTGVDPEHPAIPPVSGGARLSLRQDGRLSVGDDWLDAAGHGTACAALATRGIHARVALRPVRVMDEQGAATVGLLDAALGWAVETGAKVVNVSLGASAWDEPSRERLAATCAHAARRGVVIVAAAGAEGAPALPAALPDVISVGSAVCPPDALYAGDGQGADFLAKGDLQRIAWLEGATVLGRGTSLAAAHVTNMVCRLLLREPGLGIAGVRAALAARALGGDRAAGSERHRRVDAFYRGRSPSLVSFLGRAAVYPFNKETHSLVRFRDLLPFRLAAVADPPGKHLSGRDAGVALGDPPAGIVVEPSFERALAAADSLILGHLEALSTTPRALLRQLVERAVAQGKGVFSLSRLRVPELAELRAEAARRGIPLVDPTTSRAELRPLLADGPEGPEPLRDPRLRGHNRAVRQNLGAALIHDCPVLGVFGTSRSQGKFSLQLALRARLQRRGYRVAHLATEPTGMLFGATATLPTGYERGNDLSIDETAFLTTLLATEIKNRERPDLLLVGGQSGTVAETPELYRLGITSLGTLAFAAAAQPDACVLVANPGDSEVHVARCRAALEAVLESPVLAVAFGDQVREEIAWRGTRRQRLARLSGEALAERIGGWEARLGIPCAPVLDPAGQARIADVVVRHFASAGAEGAKELR